MRGRLAPAIQLYGYGRSILEEMRLGSPAGIVSMSSHSMVSSTDDPLSNLIEVFNCLEIQISQVSPFGLDFLTVRITMDACY